MKPRAPGAPPRLARLLVALTAPGESREAQLGDLAEEWEERARDAPAAAARWYWRQALGSWTPNLGDRLRRARRGRRGRHVGAMRTGAGGETMGTLLWNLRFALRSVRLNPSFSAVVVGTLALGIGANTTIFSAVHGLVLAPFPFPEPDRIVGVGSAYPRLGGELGFWENMSPAEYLDVLETTRTLEDVVAWDMGNRQIAGEGPPQNVFTGFWWGDALRTLGMEPHLGRGFSEEEVLRGDAVALLSHRSWRDRFGSDSTMVGRPILINGHPHTLVGILPEGVVLHGMDLWTTLPVGPEEYPRNRRQFQVMGRIADGATLTQVNAELEGIARRTEQAWASDFEEYQGWSLVALRWNEVSSRSFRTGAFVLLGAVGFVLLLVCANTANLLLARSQRRRREMAVRTALGAGRRRLLGQLLTESLVLATLGGAGGVALAWLGNAGIRAMLVTFALPVAGRIELDGPVLAFTAAVALGAGLVFGLLPALSGARARVGSVLQAEGKATTAGTSRQRLQRALVALEVALAFVLLAGCGLLLNSYLRVNRVEPGFDHESLLTMRLTLPGEEYQGEAVPAFFLSLTERLEAVPGIRSAAAGDQFPPIGFSARELWFEGAVPTESTTAPRALTTLVTPGYFETLGVPLRAGRVFDARDGREAPRVAILNEAAARRYYGTESPVGRRLKVGGPDAEGPWFEIVGVVGSTQNRGLERAPDPEVFAVHEQIGDFQNQLFLLLRTEGEPRALIPEVRAIVTEMDADQPIYAIQTVEEAFTSSIATRRATTLLLTVFGVFALVLAAVGIYAVVAFTVSERTREIGLRVALGADGGRVRRLVVGQALIPVGVGAVLGMGGALLLGRGLRQLLFEVSATDPLTMGGVATVLVGVAALASLVPAWRASRLDPVEALRRE